MSLTLKYYQSGDSENTVLRKILDNQTSAIINGGGGGGPVDPAADIDWTGQHTFTLAPEVGITDIGAFANPTFLGHGRMPYVDCDWSP